ncbi:MAG: DNA polymerase III subunit delta' [Desulfobacterales bacterium]
MSVYESTFGFESILGQKQPIRLLTTLLQNGTIPHALLFIGIEGVGKKTAAMALAMACNCMAIKPTHHSERMRTRTETSTPYNRITTITPCGCCKSCRKIESGNHPDIILLKPSGTFIRIGQIRNLLGTLAMKPFEARCRVVIISDAQAMNPSAGNALLKVLEEPPDRTILILTALQTSDLLPTIVSRCQHIRFNPISRKNLESLLLQRHGANSDEAKIIAIMANGSASKAVSMINIINRVNWINRRIWLINEVESLPLSSMGSRMAFAEKLSKSKEILDESLEVIKFWFRDLVVCKYHPEKIINRDLNQRIQRASEKMNVTSLISKINDIESAQKHIQANTNLRLTLEVLIMRLAKV